MVICSDCGATVSFAGHITPEECARSWEQEEEKMDRASCLKSAESIVCSDRISETPEEYVARKYGIRGDDLGIKGTLREDA